MVAAVVDTALGGEVSVLDTLQLMETRPYRISFSPDWVGGAFGYSSAFGLGGAFQLSLSDVLGNHRFYFASDLFYSIEESNFLAVYYYLPRRVDLGIGAFHFKNYYYSRTTSLGEEFSEEKFFSERNYGITGLASYPFGKFRRLDFDVTHLIIDRRFHQVTGFGFTYPDPLVEGARRHTVTSAGVSLVGDSSGWFMFGPSRGSRWQISYSQSVKTTENSLLYHTVGWDLRRYTPLGRQYSIAWRAAGGVSGGKHPQQFTIGGGYTLRGYDDFAFNGSRAVLASAELRFPFISHLGFVWPLPIELGNLRGVAFWDMGKAWSAEDDQAVSEAMKSPSSWLSDEGMRASFGFGVHTLVSMFLIRVDVAWPTDLDRVGGPHWHLTFGPEF
jgi:outer membrane protein assembly factor BamA